MYSQERFEWWKEKSLDKSHQDAYNKITQRIPPNGKIFLDVGCGTGEVLKRACKNTNYSLYVGTDSSESMINTSRENLKNSGIEAKVAINLKRQSQNKRKVLLFHDDILNSEIPYNFADAITFVFPEVYASVNATDETSHNEIHLGHAFLSIFKRVRVGGTFLFVPYDVASSPEREKRVLDNLKEIWDEDGLNLETCEFFENPEVWADAADSTKLGEGETPGYRIIKATRIK
ncbi:class I SAM-dependent methyltransferase [Candidatus Pacearchaeota archaeon]|nr:class I SAM-dependent methyltransferase [Candidatus Pacearchaeota archaeon]